MRNILTIARVDLLIYLKDRGNLIQLIGLPVILTLVLGGVFVGGSGPDRIRIDLLDLDDSARSQAFVDNLRAVNPTLLLCPQEQDDENVCNLDEEAVLDTELSVNRVRDGATNALLVLPQGYEAALEALEPVTLPYFSAAAIAASDPVLQSIEAALQRVNGAVVAARVGVGLGEALAVTDDDAARTALADGVYAQADAAWGDPSVAVTYTTTRPAEETGQAANGYSQSVPGMATFFVVFSVMGGGMIMLIKERQQGTLPRMATMPLRRGEILAGKILSRFLTGIIQFLIVFAVGVVVGVDFGNSPVALLLVVVVYVLAVTALGFALAPRMRNEGQASALTTMLGMTMAALGGAWWPLSIAPEFMQIVGHLTPVAWAMDAFQQIFFFGGGLGDVLLPVGVLAVATVVLFAIGIRTFRYS